MSAFRGRDRHRPTGCVRARLVRRDGDERSKVRVPGDDECAVVVVDDVIGEERDRDAVRQCQGGRGAGVVDGVNLDEAERGGGDGEVGV